MNPLVIANLTTLLARIIENGPAILKTGGEIASLAKGIVANVHNNNPDFAGLHNTIDRLQAELNAPLPPLDPSQSP